MKRFRLTADTTFEAKNIDDALLKLSEHFKRMGGDGSEPAEKEFIFESVAIEISRI